jgi:hypothetical protein
MDKEHKEKMEKRWRKLQEIQGYTDEDMAIFRSNPEFVAVMTGNAHLITDEMPKYVCAFALAAAVPRIYAIWERFHEDLDPDGLLFKTIHCPDVGCKRGGWGEIIMKVYAKEVPKELQVKLQDAKE